MVPAPASCAYALYAVGWSPSAVWGQAQALDEAVGLDWGVIRHELTWDLGEDNGCV